MKVLTDFHHHALAESLLMLFEDRMGAEVWFPAGMDWFTRDYWAFEKAWHGDRVARQYLDGIWADAARYEDGTLVRPDPRHVGRTHRGITLDAALDTRWDLVISSLPHNDVGFHRLARQTGARFGVQVGNAHQDSAWDLAEFVLSSSTLPGLVHPDTWGTVRSWQGVPTVVYHQEFDLHRFRHEWPPANGREVASWVNCFPEGPSYPWFTQFARAHEDEFDFRVYGASGSPGPDEFSAGDISDADAVADAMRGARIAWHSKHWSDGFGHVIHDWFAIGRPVVGIARYYADKLAGPLFVEGVTSYDIERYSEHELVDILRRLRDDDDHHRQMCLNAAQRFRELVDFDREAETIARMLGAGTRQAVPA